ncbi:MAG: hypothetical protein ACI4GY_09510, partial [Acutalibacteraceae bacterium]
CKQLKSVYLGKNYRFSDLDFFGCDALEEFSLSEENEAYSVVDGVLYSKDKTTVCAYPPGKNAAAYKIDNSVTQIDSYAFAYTPNLKELYVINKDCSFDENSIVKDFPADFMDVGSPEYNCDITIYGFEGSTAEQYAQDKGFAFSSILSEKVASVEIADDSVLSVYRSESLPENAIKLIFKYTDGTSQVIDSGYEISGLDSSVIGTQDVVITCDDISIAATIDVLPKIYVDESLSFYLNEEESVSIKFEPDESSTYTVFSKGDINSYCKLRDQDGNVLTSDVNGGLYDNFRISYFLEAGNTYYFDVSSHYSGTTTITVVNHEHDYTVERTEPTCTGDGEEIFTCECGDQYETVIDCLGHDLPDEWTTRTDATCEKPGIEYKACSRCDYEETRETDPLGHVLPEEWTTRTEPTCEKTGIEFKACSRCDYEETHETDALGHDYSDEWTIDLEPTCTTDGSKSHHCSRCDSKSDITGINALGHEYTTSVVAPTCTTDGYTAHTCTRCGYTYNDEIVPAFGHSFKDETFEVSCTKDGYTKHTCTVCSYSYKDNIIEKLNHDMSDFIRQSDPDCTNKGIEKSTCSRCDYYQTREISSLGHDYSEWETVKEPTVLANGLKKQVCSRCKKVQTAAIPKIEIDITENTDYGLCNFTVVNAQTKESIKNASIFISTENDGENTFTTDANGKASVVLPVGQQNISVYTNGCQTRSLSINVTSGTNEIAQIGLSSQNIYDATLTSHRMTQEEIIAYGIDTDDPANQNVYSYSLKIEYEAQPAPVIINFAKNDSGIIYSPKDGEGGTGYIYVPESNIRIAPVTENLYVIVHGDVKWQKEIFDVELLVVNNSSTDTLEELNANLNLPDGLSLAAMSGNEQSICQNIGTVEENSSKSVHWFVCGDKAGSYNISANLTGKVMPFDEPIDQTYYGENALQVWAGNALKLSFEMPDIAYYGEDYPITVSLTNVSDIALYNINHALAVYQGMEYYYSDGRTKKKLQTSPGNSFSVDCLNPGDSIIIETTVNIFFESEVINMAKQSMIEEVNRLEKANKIYKIISTTLDAANSICENAKTVVVSIKELELVVEPASLSAVCDLYEEITDFAKTLSDDKEASDKLFKYSDKLVDIADDISSFAEDPKKFAMEKSADVIGKLASKISGLNIAYQEDSTDTDYTFNIFNTLRCLISEWPVEFLVTNLVMTDNENSTTKIPYTVNIIHSDEDHYHGVNNMTECVMAMMNIGVHELLRPLMYMDILNYYDKEEVYTRSIKQIQAKENELKAFNAKTSNNDVKWTVSVIKNAQAETMSLSESAIEENRYTLECTGNNAAFENGVLTFNGPGYINFKALENGEYTLVIENEDGLSQTYEISVAEEHECIPGDSEYIIAPVNSSDGLSMNRCTICGEIMNLSIVSPDDCDGHEFGDKETVVEATCHNNGKNVQECLKCGYVKTEDIEALEHTSDGGIITEEPTCSSEGMKIYTCTVCSMIFKSEPVEKLPHNYKSEITQPTCEEKGYTTYVCTSCGNSYKDNYTDATGHTSSDWIVDHAASCIAEGSRHKVCTVCGNITETERIEKLAHSYIDNVVAPSCTENGYTIHICTICGEILIDSYIDATGHIDLNDDWICDNCEDTIEPDAICSHMCHKSGFVGFIWKIINFFNKLFKINKVCDCGAVHY